MRINGKAYDWSENNGIPSKSECTNMPNDTFWLKVTSPMPFIVVKYSGCKTEDQFRSSKCIILWFFGYTRELSFKIIYNETGDSGAP